MEGWQIVLTPENVGRKTLEDRVKGKSIFGRAVVLGVVVVFVFLVVPCCGRTITVDDDGPADFDNIQAAINDANDGDEVVVADGNYSGEGNHDIDFLGKAITVRSMNGRGNCEINCQGMGRGFFFHSGEDSNSVVDGFYIHGGYIGGPYSLSGEGGGIYCRYSSPRIKNCWIMGNMAERGAGIYCYLSSPVIENCYIGYNDLSVIWDVTWGGGIYCERLSNPTIINCTISNNKVSKAGGGIYSKESKPKLINCTISDNEVYDSFGYGREGGGIYYAPGGRDWDPNSLTMTGCYITANTAKNDGGGIYCKGCNLTVTDCNISSNISEEGRGGGIYFNSSKDPNIVDSVIRNNWSRGMVMEGGGGICCDNSNPNIRGCTISGNITRYGFGAGICRTGGSISDCVISGNIADPEATVNNCSGGGLYDCDGAISNCIIRNNRADWGGGLCSCDGPIVNCIIADNSAEYGGALGDCDGPISNCIISGNHALISAGALSYCGAEVINCTITDNSADEFAGGIWCSGNISSFTNCILWGNDAPVGPEMYLEQEPSTSVSYTVVQGGLDALYIEPNSTVDWGQGNIDADPCFVDANSNDYHLLTSSPCIDAGDPNYYPGPEVTDIDGEPRVMGLRVDMGADEVVGLSIDLSMDELWMYQNLPGQVSSNIAASASITYDPNGNSSYSYAWEIILPGDVSLAPVTVAGGGAGDAYWTFAARGCDEPGGLSDSGQTFTVRVTITGDDYGNTGQAEAEFGIALLGDINNDGVVNVADRSIANAFWRTGSAGPYTLRDCDVNCDGVVNVADRSIANAIWRGILGQNSVSSPCPLR
ncbi:MAG: right-handed parallel beta-helix repeat-containing protein [Planctomycetota bacterium]|nr:MAG: right-handed parallel beta-helix repeat-containing protein [Planctomycetota bacterium]